MQALRNACGVLRSDKHDSEVFGKLHSARAKSALLLIINLLEKADTWFWQANHAISV